MGWLWACLGGGPGSLSSRRSKSLRGKLSNQPHDLRLQPLPTQLPRHGYGVLEPSHVQYLQSRGPKGGEAGNVETFRIPATSTNTCISINSLKKASEKTLESSFREEFGLTMRSDVDELKEEMAALRRRLAKEEAEAKKLREEVSYLRSCGVLQRSEDSSDTRIYENFPDREASTDQANEEQRQGDIAPVKQLRKCFSGPLLFGSPSTSTNDSTEDSSDSSTMVSQSTQTRISSHRVGLSPKGKSFGQKAQTGEVDQLGDEGVVATRESNPRTSKGSLTSGLHLYPSTKMAAWTSQITEDQGMSKNLTVMDSMDVHWIEVADASAPCGFSTNVRRDRRPSSDRAESPRRPNLGALLGAEEDDASKKLIGKRRQKRSVDFNEPTEKRSREQSPTGPLPALTPEEIEEQLSQAVVAFKEQKRELELKHQSFCLSQGPTVTSSEPSPPPPASSVVGFFRNSKKKTTIRNNTRCGFQRALSPVKEALSIEEVTWNSRNEATVKPEDPLEREACRFQANAGTQGFKFAATIVEDSSPVKLPQEEDELDHEEIDVRPSAMENIAMVPIQCVSPSLTPKKKSASSGALDILCAAAMSSKSLPTTGSRYQTDDSLETDWIHEWEEDAEGMDMKPIECASPSFSDRRKSTPRAGSVKQSISFDAKTGFSPSLASSGEFEERSVSCGKSTPSPSGLAAYRSPASRASVTPPSPRRKQWTPSPRKDDVDPMMNERSWYCDAIDAIRSINDLRRSKEGQLYHMESVSLGNSPAGKKAAAGGTRPPHAFSAEKKMLRRAFSWYVSEHDDRMRTFGLKDTTRNGREETEDGNEKKRVLPTRVQPQQKTALIATRGTKMHARRFSDSDSCSSATFSIDFNRVGSSRNNSTNSSQTGSSQNHPHESGQGALDVRESTAASALRVDKENFVAKRGMSPSKNSVMWKSDQSLSSSDSFKHLRRSHEAIPENRPVLGSMPFNNWDKSVRTSREKNITTMHTEDSRSEWHPVASQQQAFPKVSSRGISGKIMSRSRSFV